MDTIISDLSIQSTGLANKAYQPGDDTAVDGLVTAPGPLLSSPCNSLLFFVVIHEIGQ